MARRKRQPEFIGSGCVIQGLGLLLLFWFPIGTVIGVVMLIVGSIASFHLVCSNCGNRIEKTATMCPTCRESITP